MWSAAKRVGVIGLMVGMTSGCDTDLYDPCNLDPQSQDPAQSACAQAANDGQNISCGIENSPQCGTTVCAIYQGSEAFCTQACATDADCGEQGVCREYNVIDPGSARYCVPSEVASGQ